MSTPGNTLGTSVLTLKRFLGPQNIIAIVRSMQFRPGRVVPRPVSRQNSVCKNDHKKLSLNQLRSALRAAGTAYFCTSLKTPQTAAGLGRRKISQLRTPGGVQASCAYRRTPVGRVQGCCQVCVRGCAIQRPAFKFADVFFHPRAEQTGLSGKKYEN